MMVKSIANPISAGQIPGCGAYEATINPERAREIMGKHMLGIEEVTQHFGVTFTPEQLTHLQEIPFTEATLQDCKSDHLLVVGYPLSILDIRAKVPRSLFYGHEYAWYNLEAFAKRENVDLRWYLFQKELVPASTNKTYPYVIG